MTIDYKSDINKPYAAAMNYDRVDRFIVRILWWHFVVVCILAFTNSVLQLSVNFASPISWRVLSGAEAIGAVLVGLLAAVIPTRLQHKIDNHYAWRVLISITLTTYSYLLVFLSGGAIEMHFHFFMVMALLVIYADWRLGWLVLALTAAHHGILNYVEPEWVYVYGRNDISIIAHGLPVLVMAIFTTLLCHNYRDSIKVLEATKYALRQDLIERKRIEQELAEERDRLEIHVEERTAELKHTSERMQQRATQLQANVDLSHAIASILDLNKLPPVVTQLIAEQFGFYHVAIFLVDERGEHAVLRAASGAGGQQVMALGYELNVGPGSMVGLATSVGQPYIAADVSRDQAFLSHPNLPLTRSEMVLPLQARGKIIGALDLQSDQVGTFKQEDVVVFNTLANQVAIAIENARLFEQQATLAKENRVLLERAEQAVESLDTLTRRLSGESWGKYLDGQQGELVIEDVQSDLPVSAYRSRLLPQAEGSTAAVTSTDDTPSVVTTPIVLRDEVIGTLGLEDIDPDREWSEDDLVVLREVAEDIALAVDNARLFDQTQAALAEARGRNEELSVLNEVGQGLNRLAQPNEILQLIYNAIGRLLDGRNVYIALYNEEKNELSFPIYFVDGQARLAETRPFGQGLTEHVIRSKSALLISHDVEAELTKLGVAKVGSAAKSLLITPMLAGQKVVGVIAVQDYEREGVYSEIEANVLRTLASQAAIAVENSHLLEQTQARARQEYLTRNIVTQVSSSIDLNTILKTTARQLSQALGVSHAEIRIGTPPKPNGDGNLTDSAPQPLK